MVKCSMLNIDSNDPAGQQQNLHLDRHHHVWKHRVKTVGGCGGGKMKFELIGEKQKLEPGSTFLKDVSVQEHLAELKNSDRTLHEIVSDHKKDALQGEDAEEDDVVAGCGSCYGAAEDDNECCNTCDDVKRAYSRKGWHVEDPLTFKQCQKEAALKADEGDDEGCNVHGVIALDSAGGSWHLAPGHDKSGGSSSAGAGDLSGSIFELLLHTFETFNVSHVTHKIRYVRCSPPNRFFAEIQ